MSYLIYIEYELCLLINADYMLDLIHTCTCV